MARAIERNRRRSPAYVENFAIEAESEMAPDADAEAAPEPEIVSESEAAAEPERIVEPEAVVEVRG